MILSWTLNYVSKYIAVSMIYVVTAHEVSYDLKEHFNQGNDPHTFQLEKIFFFIYLKEYAN